MLPGERVSSCKVQTLVGTLDTFGARLAITPLRDCEGQRHVRCEFRARLPADLADVDEDLARRKLRRRTIRCRNIRDEGESFFRDDIVLADGATVDDTIVHQTISCDNIRRTGCC
jgi:hypothetical protein